MNRMAEKKLYIGNLPWEIDNEKLKEFFGQAGKVVSANVILDRETGRSRGFGFVEFETEEEAKEAIHKLDGIAFNQRNIVVSEARPEAERPRIG